MKNLKFLSFVLFAVMSVSLFSCGDDEEEIGDRNTLIGTWQCTWSEGFVREVNYPDENEDWNQAVENIILVFNADGTYRLGENESGKWKLEGNELSLLDNRGGDWDVLTVLKLTDSELIIEDYEKDEYGEYYEKTTFKKI